MEGGTLIFFQTILAGFGTQCSYKIWPFWQFSEGGTFIIFGHLGRFHRAVDSFSVAFLAVLLGQHIWYFFWAIWAIFQEPVDFLFIILDHFGHIQRVANLLSSHILAISESGRFILFGHFGSFCRVIHSLFSAI